MVVAFLVCSRIASCTSDMSSITPRSGPSSRIDPASTNGTSFFTQVLEKLARIPQVQAAGVSDAVPFRMGSGWGIAIEGRPPLKPGEFNMAGVSRVSPGYLRAMGIRLLRGRGLAEADREGSPLTAVITETMAKRYWPDEDPVGKRFRPAGPTTP
jgi:hypothetical protein